MVALGYLAILGITCLLSIANWRQGVVLAVIIDVLRDPARKLMPGQPVWVTLSLLLVWVCVFIGAYIENPNFTNQALRSLPTLRKGVTYCVLALIPGTFVSLVMFENGMLLAVLGIASYLAPFLGVVLGMHYFINQQQLYRLMMIYVVVNSVALLSVLAEYLSLPIPALGGLQGVVWLRSQGMSHFLLVSGFYRGPDIAGLHAAHVVIFSIVLAMHRLSRTRTPWFATAVWGIITLILAGRRKMLIMPIVFGIAYLLFNRSRGVSIFQKALIPASILLGAAALFLGWLDENFVSSDYSYYATSIITEGQQRAKDSIWAGSIDSINRYGLLGSGIGTATQGGRYFGIEQSWQEDGISRLFSELGLLGVFILAAGLYNLFLALQASQTLCRPSYDAANVQSLLFSVGLADASSYIVSHQHFSGDPGAAVFILLLVGMAVSVPFHMGLAGHQRAIR